MAFLTTWGLLFVALLSLSRHLLKKLSNLFMLGLKRDISSSKVFFFHLEMPDCYWLRLSDRAYPKELEEALVCAS